MVVFVYARAPPIDAARTVDGSRHESSVKHCGALFKRLLLDSERIGDRRV